MAAPLCVLAATSEVEPQAGGLRLHLADVLTAEVAHLAQPDATPRNGFGGSLRRLDPLDYPTLLVAALQEDQRRLRTQWSVDVHQLEEIALAALHDTAQLREELSEAEEGRIAAESEERRIAEAAAEVEEEASEKAAEAAEAVQAAQKGLSAEEALELFREMEGLEHALLKERRRSEALQSEAEEERRRAEALAEALTSAKAAHARDVAVLEVMLQQGEVDNEQLANKLKQVEASPDGLILPVSSRVSKTLPESDPTGLLVREEATPSEVQEPEVELSVRNSPLDVSVCSAASLAASSTEACNFSILGYGEHL